MVQPLACQPASISLTYLRILTPPRRAGASFQTALADGGGDSAVLMGPLAATLNAISAAAVFMGALTYIGNAPNLMVSVIARDMGVKMPGFFGYMMWSFGILGPLLALVWWFKFA